MHAAAEAKGVVHLLGTEFRWSTGQALAARAMAEGRVGEPRLATFMLHMPALADPSGEVPGWWTDRSEGGGWLGAYASHIIDQVQTLCGRFTGVSASLDLLADRDWSAEDTYTVHFRTERGASGVIQSSAGSWGMPFGCSRVVGTRGTLSIEGDAVNIGTAAGIEKLEVPDDLVLAAPEPPPTDLLVTQYDMLHSMGIDLAPYTRLFEALRARIADPAAKLDPAPATFEDGLAGQAVLDAIRRSSAEETWIPVEIPGRR